MKGLLTTTILLVSLLGYNDATDAAGEPQKVSLEFFVMSHCPGAVVIDSMLFQERTDFNQDARFCERFFNPIVQQLAPILNVSMHYIGGEKNGQFECMHGPTECMDNRMQLCAREQTEKWWDFVIEQDGGASTATSNDWNTTALRECAISQRGAQLLSESFRYTESKGVKKSCTMFIQGKLFCVHDGTWKKCKTHDEKKIVQYLCSHYTGESKPAACTQPIIVSQ
ncbi:hypothetical protein PROFUN_13181 [Planoprotostelium fungivorum]|uniref:Uncharacterized protein n=1 Tax=Planoprotostelium fungivorum TaxID=1890364 RepID=A0A2P6N546_9EUKA|nr:hypothetical protein PROFUN_13181 [Planoprotostelium fungivorum]